MSALDLLVDLHVRNDRQGPGSDAETLRAMGLARLTDRRHLKIADIGCGTGASCRVLASKLPGSHITAVDAVEPFIERLRERVAGLGLAERIDAVVGDMKSLPFGDDSFDVIWSEGAIYNMGFAEGLRSWRRFLRPGGVIGVSELTWTTAGRPADVDAHWNREYPGIATGSSKLRTVEQEGYEPLGMFFLSRDCWDKSYYRPLRAGIAGFLERHGDSRDARQIVEAEEAEMSLYRDRGMWYNYGFYLARKVDVPLA